MKALSQKLLFSCSLMLSFIGGTFLKPGDSANPVYGQTVSPESVLESSAAACLSRELLEGVCCLAHVSVVTTGQHCLESEGTWFAGHGANQPTPCPSPCHADVSGDGVVNTTDFTLLLQAWGWCPQS